MTKFLTLILIFQIFFISCQSNDDSNLDDIVDDKFQFSILKYELNSILDLFLERYGFQKPESQSELVKKLLINELYDQNMDYIFNIIFPTPEFTVGNSPKLLVTSPRSKIERKGELLLTPSLSINEIEALESATENKDLSSIIIDIGGIAAYPSIISDGKNLRELFLTVSHEWLHQYLIFHPLGRSYFSSPEMKEINETLANIFSNKLLDDLCKKNFELKNEVCEQYKKSNKTEFNYREFMKSLRTEVDSLLADRKINDAEKLMQESTSILNSNGIKIRKINQAWFAFNGTYGDSPSSISNFNDELNDLIDSYDNLNDAINDIKNISSLDDYKIMIE